MLPLLINNLKIRPEDRKEGTIGKETMSNIGTFVKDQYEKIPEDTREGFEQGVVDAATGIQSWNKQLREDNYWGGIGPLDPFIAAGNVYNTIAPPIKKEISIQTGLAPSVVETGEVALDFLTPGIPLGAKKAQKVIDEVFDRLPSGKVYATTDKVPKPKQLSLGLPTDPAGKEALRILKEKLARNSGYKSLASWKREVLNKWPQKDQDQIFRQLWENKQYEGYIEHKVGKASRKGRKLESKKEYRKTGTVTTPSTDTYDMDWYWDKDFIDADGVIKPGLNKGDRDSIKNVRLLFNERYKKLKDTAEGILYGTDNNPGIGVLNPDLKKRLIIDVEDPMSKQGVWYHKRQNPGDIVIKRAGSGEIIGNLGQYLDVLYPPNPGDQRRIEYLVKKIGFEDITDFRKKVIEERINIIVRDSPKLLSEPIELRPNIIQKAIDDDMDNLLNKYPFLRPQAVIQSQISKDPGMSTKALRKDRTKKRGPFPSKREILNIEKAKRKGYVQGSLDNFLQDLFPDE